MYGNWYAPDYVGFNPGCTPTPSGGLDCYYTNPCDHSDAYQLPHFAGGGMRCGACGETFQGAAVPEWFSARVEEEQLGRYPMGPGSVNQFNQNPYAHPGLLPGARYAFGANPGQHPASIWCPDCQTRICEPEELARYTGTQCPSRRCGADLPMACSSCGEEIEDGYPHQCENPGGLLPGWRYALNPIDIRGRSVPTSHSKGGRYHHVRVGDPDEYTQIRTKTLSERKGIKARMGRFQGRGPRGGRTEVQSYMFDADRYTPEDAVRWMEGHPTPAPLHMDISPMEATDRRYKVYGKAPAKKKPRRKKVAKKVAARKKKATKKKATKKKASKKRAAANPAKGGSWWSKLTAGDRKKIVADSEKPTKKKKAKKKKRAWKVPAKADRCVAKKSDGSQCKGRRLGDGDQCALHKHGIARTGKNPRKKAKKKDTRTNRQRCRTSRVAQCAAKTNCGSRCKSYAVGRSKFCRIHKAPQVKTGRTRKEGKRRK
jgi:hypothetical protein